MEPLNLSPQKDLKTMWLIIWSVISCFVALPLIVGVIFIPDKGGQIIAGIILSIFTVFMVLLRIWIPAFFLSIEYGIDEDAVKMNCGVFFKRRVTVPFRKITNVDISQGPLQRMYNVGTIHVQTAGAGGAQGAQAELRFSGIRELEELKERIMDGMRGHIAAEVKSANNETRENSDASMLKDILDELRAIKSVLENK